VPHQPPPRTLGDAVAGRTVVVAETWSEVDGGEISDVEFDGCTLFACHLGGALLRRVTLRECVVDSCDLSGIRLVDVRLIDSRFERCKALGVGWSSIGTSAVSTRPLDMDRCRLDFGSFAGGHLSGSRFTGCSLIEADFSGADLRGVDFTGADLTGARFSDADLRAATLVGVSGIDIDPASTRLAGARLSVDAAFRVLSALGVEVVADDA
jgi:fluoroquinolone resistance protein